MSFLSSENHSSQLIESKEGLWEPLVFSWLVRSAGDTLNLQLVSEFQGRGSWEPPICSPLVRSTGDNQGFRLAHVRRQCQNRVACWLREIPTAHTGIGDQNFSRWRTTCCFLLVPCQGRGNTRKVPTGTVKGSPFIQIYSRLCTCGTVLLQDHITKTKTPGKLLTE